MHEHNNDNHLDQTVPNSLKAQLERAENLLSQSEHAGSRGDHHLAAIRAREGAKVLIEIARQTPDHATLLMGAELGFRNFEIECIERIDSFQVVERKILGLTVSTDVVNLPKITHRIHRGRLF